MFMKISGIEIEDLNELRVKIVLYFGSIYAFHKRTKYSYTILKRVLNDLDFTKEEFEDIEKVYEDYFDDETIPFRISEEDTKKIRICILTNFDKFKDFSKKHKEFNRVYLSNIINGRLKMRTTKYVRLISLLNSKYGLQIKLESNESNEIGH